MSDWILSIEGTATGERVALILALLAALLHAIFGALQKGRIDPWLSRASIDAGCLILAAPVALFVVPWPQGDQWLVMLGAVVIMFFYKVGQALAYSRGAYTVVYPVVRGTGPLFTIVGAYLLFGEQLTGTQWLGVALLTCAILGLAAYNLRHVEIERATLVPALWFALGTGALVAVYTTYGAYGIRSMPDPFTFIAWFFFLIAIDFTLLLPVFYARASDRPAASTLIKRGFIGALVGVCSFGAIMLATRLDKVGEAAVLRETSTVFAALIGWLFLKETVGPRRAALMAAIAAGAVIVEFGG